MKHTKGPWKFIGWDGQAEIRSADNSETQIALLGNRGDGAIPNEKTRANAERIVICANSHDELLEALKGLLHSDLCEQEQDPKRLPEFERLVHTARVAINKAEGK